jgi:L-ascorbate metabolism protein UlaG (beta-lactamase superfamily)
MPRKSSPKAVRTPDREFLRGIEVYEKESIGLQVTAEINDWLDEVVKAGRRNYGKKIPKQVWIQASIELLRAMPVDWGEVAGLEDLREKLTELSQRVKKNS